MLQRRQAGDGAERRRAAAAGDCTMWRGRTGPASSCRPARCSGLTRCAPRARARSRGFTSSTRKPPDGLDGAPYLVEHGIRSPSRERQGRVQRQRLRRGAGFPANVNVAAALALAGIGPDRTRSRSGPTRGGPATPTHPAGGRDGPPHLADRERPVENPENRTGHAALGRRAAAQARQLRSRIGT